MELKKSSQEEYKWLIIFKKCYTFFTIKEMKVKTTISSQNNYYPENERLARWRTSYEHLLFLQRMLVQFPAPT